MTAAASAPAAMDTLTTRNQPLPSRKSVPLPDAAESPSSLSLPSEDPQGHTAEDQGQQVTEEQLHRERNTGHSSEEREEGGSVSGCPVEEGGSKDDQEDKITLAKVEAEPESSSPTLRKVDQEEKKEQQGGGFNCGTAAQVRVKDTGLASGERQGPLEEASSELQKEGIRLKIKIPPHRRSKLRGKGGKEGQKERGEEEEPDEGRMLRRSSRICRSSALPNCRPSSKASESQRKKPKQTQALSDRMGEEDEEEQSLTTKKEGKKEPVGQIRKQRGKRRHRRPRWSNVRVKRRKLNDEEEVEDRGRKRGEEEEDQGRKRGEEESEEGSDSEELCKSQELPSEDACSHCGLPNHPELILLCDSCDSGYHTACLRPPLMLIPDGQWFCPPCQHVSCV
ncbi:remodeling and spacing factor 1-like [Notothenia coriiceps]|uniref:Remodeling and spacing factor 1-like n=1 Tax=Notothenia coriiceps TaxID=8208 RepID=A0A6I9NGD1_9TELE|nr:PREDICTED: remodeling and spacing factor 1-like [Notothenia coriiceps]